MSLVDGHLDGEGRQHKFSLVDGRTVVGSLTPSPGPTEGVTHPPALVRVTPPLSSETPDDEPVRPSRVEYKVVSNLSVTTRTITPVVSCEGIVTAYKQQPETRRLPDSTN